MYRKHLKSEFYTRKAQEEGYPARSVYKLKEIVEKYRVIKKRDKVLDLGCSPGSWLIYISKIVGEKGKVAGVDIEDIKTPVRNNITFVKKSVFDLRGQDLNNFSPQYNVVVSDLAPKTTGIKSVDDAKSLELAERAFEIAKSVLVSNGNFVCKIFEGEGVDEFFRKVSNDFKTAKRFRPKAVSRGSKEFYIIGIGFKKNGK